LRELSSVLECAALSSPGDVILLEHLPPFADGEGRTGSELSSFRSEKDWLLHGLRRNRFRRGLTAEYLGVSRKTLYNKMRAYGLLPASRQGAAGGNRPAPSGVDPALHH
jgi:transcriptional regulator of acetoin/glycerol metabolism